MPDLEALALSAQLSERLVKALLAVLEEAGLVTLDDDTIRITTAASEFEEQARSLAGRFVTLRTQDGRRLDRLAEYANTERVPRRLPAPLLRRGSRAAVRPVRHLPRCAGAPVDVLAADCPSGARQATTAASAAATPRAPPPWPRRWWRTTDRCTRSPPRPRRPKPRR